MATTQTQSNVNISDIPEELKPFRQAGLEALMSLVFDPAYIQNLKNRGVFPAGTNPVAGGGGAAGSTGSGSGVGDPGFNATRAGQQQGSNQMLSDNNIASLMARLNGSQLPPASGDRIAAAMGSKLASADAQSDGQVHLVDVNKPLGQLGNQTPGGGVGPVVWIGTTPNYSGSQQNYRPVLINPTYGNAGGSNPGTGGGSGGSGGSGGGSGSQGGSGGSGGRGNSQYGHPPATGPDPNYGATPGTGTFIRGAIGNFNGLPTGSEYNPNQYASDALAQQLANSLGATVSHTNVGGPNGPPSQNVLDFGIGGSGNMLNAGLVNQMLTDPSQSPFAAQRLRDELAMLSRNAGSAWTPYKKGGRIKKQGIARYDTGGLTPGSNYPYAPYTPFQGQRFLDYNTVPGANNIPTSSATRTAEQGLSQIPSVFDQYGGINAGRDENGNSTTNFGIANDQMDWAGRKLGDAIEGYGSIANNAQQIGSGFNFQPQLNSAGQIQVDPMTRYQISPSAQWTQPGAAQAYMNPYMDAVTNVQKQRAIDDFNEQRGYRNSQAVAAGAYGGSRQAVQEGVAQRALARNLQGIDAQGLNNAYTQGMGQFNADRQADFNTNKANLDSSLQTQGLATQAGLTAAQANQSTNAQQFRDLLNAQAEAERLRQSALSTSGNLGLQAMQGITGAAGALSSVGATRADLQRLAQQLEQDRLTSMAKVGAAQDSRAQQGLDFQYQNFVNQKNWPFQLQNFYTSQLSGMPMGVNQEQVQFQNYSPLSQWGGLITSGIGALGQAIGGNKQG